MGSPLSVPLSAARAFSLVAKAKGAAFRYVGGVTDPQSGDVDARTFESLIVAGFSFVKNCFFPSSSSSSFSLPGLRIIIWKIGIFRALNCRYLFNKFVEIEHDRFVCEELSFFQHRMYRIGMRMIMTPNENEKNERKEEIDF